MALPPLRARSSCCDRFVLFPLAGGALLLLVACSVQAGDPPRAAPDAGDDKGQSPRVDAGVNPVDRNEQCEVSDVLFILDRSMSMHRRPDGTRPSNYQTQWPETKWARAVESVHQTVNTFDGTINFGLSLFPRDPQDGTCVSLQERIEGQVATNAKCEGPDLVAAPGASGAESILAELDVHTTRLCWSTPIAIALQQALTQLDRPANDSPPAKIILITDGQETCDRSAPLPAVQALARAGVETHVIGFDGTNDGVDIDRLNHLACAGHTAAGFPNNCHANGPDYDAGAGSATPLFHLVADGDALAQALDTIAAEVCCDCAEVD